MLDPSTLIRLERSRDDMMDKLRGNVSQLTHGTPEQLYGQAAANICREQWRSLLADLSQHSQVDEELVTMRNMCIALRRQLKRHNALARRVHRVLLGRSDADAAPITEVDHSLSELVRKSEQLRDEMFATQSRDEAVNGHPFSPEDFTLAEYWRLAEFKLREAAKHSLQDDDGLSARTPSQSKLTVTSVKKVEREIAVGTLKREHRQQVVGLERDMEALRTAMERQVAALQTENDELRSAHNTEIDDMRDQFDAELARREEEVANGAAAVSEDFEFQLLQQQQQLLAAVGGTSVAQAERQIALENIRVALATERKRREDTQAQRQSKADELTRSSKEEARTSSELAAAGAAAADPRPAQRTSSFRSSCTTHDADSKFDGESRESLLARLEAKKGEMQLAQVSFSVQTKARTMEWDSTLREIIARFESDLLQTQQFLDRERQRTFEFQKSVDDKKNQIAQLSFDLHHEQSVTQERIVENERVLAEDMAYALRDTKAAQKEAADERTNAVATQARLDAAIAAANDREQEVCREMILLRNAITVKPLNDDRSTQTEEATRPLSPFMLTGDQPKHDAAWRSQSPDGGERRRREKHRKGDKSTASGSGSGVISPSTPTLSPGLPPSLPTSGKEFDIDSDVEHSVPTSPRGAAHKDSEKHTSPGRGTRGKTHGHARPQGVRPPHAAAPKKPSSNSSSMMGSAAGTRRAAGKQATVSPARSRTVSPSNPGVPAQPRDDADSHNEAWNVQDAGRDDDVHGSGAGTTATSRRHPVEGRVAVQQVALTAELTMARAPRPPASAGAAGAAQRQVPQHVARHAEQRPVIVRVSRAASGAPLTPQPVSAQPAAGKSASNGKQRHLSMTDLGGDVAAAKPVEDVTPVPRARMASTAYAAPLPSESSFTHAESANRLLGDAALRDAVESLSTLSHGADTTESKVNAATKLPPSVFGVIPQTIDERRFLTAAVQMAALCDYSITQSGGRVSHMTRLAEVVQRTFHRPVTTSVTVRGVTPMDIVAVSTYMQRSLIGDDNMAAGGKIVGRMRGCIDQLTRFVRSHNIASSMDLVSWDDLERWRFHDAGGGMVTVVPPAVQTVLLFVIEGLQLRCQLAESIANRRRSTALRASVHPLPGSDSSCAVQSMRFNGDGTGRSMARPVRHLVAAVNIVEDSAVQHVSAARMAHTRWARRKPAPLSMLTQGQATASPTGPDTTGPNSMFPNSLSPR
jgi:hypothetical protein